MTRKKRKKRNGVGRGGDRECLRDETKEILRGTRRTDYQKHDIKECEKIFLESEDDRPGLCYLRAS